MATMMMMMMILTMTMPDTLAPDTPVVHPKHGTGRVIADTGEFVVARFGAIIQQVLRSELTIGRSVEIALATRTLDDSADTLIRASALAIRSVNDQWGVFSRSRVQLLPHQLWVCHKVNRTFPFRWLVADDVGLGKTIEAGLILMPLVARAQIRRLLVLAPAKLVPQWQKRMRQMFDLRLQVYDRAVDTPAVDFWDTANMVVASVHTLRREIAAGRAEGSRFLDEGGYADGISSGTASIWKRTDQNEKACRCTRSIQTKCSKESWQFYHICWPGSRLFCYR